MLVGMSRPQEILPQIGPITVVKAWLMGFLAGDGHVGRKHGAGFNTNCQLAARVAQALREVYGVDPPARLKDRPQPRKPIWTVYFGRLIAEDLWRNASWGIDRWTVPTAVQEGPTEVKAAWLRGFFDAEGTSHAPSANGKNKWRVTAPSVNESGLRSAGELLTSLGIGFKFYGPYTRKKEPWNKPAFVITIHKRSEVIRYASIVGFVADCKTANLDGIVEAPFGNKTEWLPRMPLVAVWLAEGKKHHEIDRALGLTDGSTTKALLYYRRKAGIPKKRLDSLGPLAAQVVQLAETGLSYAEIARKIDVPLYRVRAAFAWHRKQAGIPKTVRGAKYEARLLAIREAGLTTAAAPEVARKLGLTVKQAEAARRWAGCSRGRDWRGLERETAECEARLNARLDAITPVAPASA